MSGDLTELLHDHWGLTSSIVEPLGGGMNSATWLVRSNSETFVAKQVAAGDATDFANGCEIALQLAGRGLRTGPPRRLVDGRLVLAEPPLALLEHVPGRELDGESAREQCLIATALAAVHHAGEPHAGQRTTGFFSQWLSPDPRALATHPWLAAALASVREETASLRSTWSILHTDPAPEAFVHEDSTGITGVIDWSGATRGPILYDVASAVMYLGGTDSAAAFLATYAATGPLGADELSLLDAFRRFRWAVQGSYFARRLAEDDLTGIADRTENLKGLHDAREGLAALGVDVA